MFIFLKTFSEKEKFYYDAFIKICTQDTFVKKDYSAEESKLMRSYIQIILYKVYALKEVDNKQQVLDKLISFSDELNIDFKELKLSLPQEESTPASMLPLSENKKNTDKNIMEAATIFCNTFKPAWNVNFFTSLFQDKNNPSNKLFHELNKITKSQLSNKNKVTKIGIAVTTFLDQKMNSSTVNSQALKVLETSGLKELVKKPSNFETNSKTKN